MSTVSEFQSRSLVVPVRRLNVGVLDGLRGLAAFYVLLQHAYQILWVGYSGYVGVGEGGAFGHLLAYTAMQLTRYGTQAVLVFFLISGFCIHYRQATVLARSPVTSAETPLMNYKAYAWRRFRRLYPPLALALVLTATFDYVGARLTPNLYADGTWVSQGHSVIALAGNLALQSGLSVPVFGSDAPLWSLGFEFWFYLLYPVLLFVSMRAGPGRSFLAILAVSGMMFGVMQITGIQSPSVGLVNFPGFWLWRILAYWAVWAAGALIADMYAGRMRTPDLRFIGPFGVALVLLAWIKVVKLGPSYQDDVLWGTGFALVMAYTMLCPPGWFAMLVQRMARLLTGLGDISYSLYTVHYPFLLLLSAWWLSSHDRLPLGPELACVGLAGSLALAVICWFMVERHFVRSHKDSRGRSVADIRVAAGLHASSSSTSLGVADAVG
jgi:peptidoglycan/LPS O-acetylase OafA/YrhL